MWYSSIITADDLLILKYVSNLLSFLTVDIVSDAGRKRKNWGKNYVIFKPWRKPRHRKEDDSVNDFKIDLFVDEYSFWGKEVVSDTNIFLKNVSYIDVLVKAKVTGDSLTKNGG